MSKPRPTNEVPPEPRTATSDPLGPYRALADELIRQVTRLSLLHDQRSSFHEKADALKAERTPLEGRILDAPESADALKDLRLLDDQLRLNDARLSAIAPRVNKAETELHAKFPLALLCFERLRGRVVSCVLDSAKESVTKLLAPGYTVPEDVINQIAIATPAFVEITRLKTPGLTYLVSRGLDEAQPHWSSLTRPYTEAEKRAQRAETVGALISATKELCEAAGTLVELAAKFPQGHIPEFKCEKEQPIPAVSVAPVEWNESLLEGSDLEFAESVAKAAGTTYEALSDEKKRIVDDMVRERRKGLVSHGSMAGAEMFGNTFVP